MPVITQQPGGGGGDGGGTGGLPAFGPRRDWQFILGFPGAGWVTPLAQATARSITWNLTDAHEASFTVNANAGYDQGISPLATDLHVLYGGVPVFRGRIGPQQDQIVAGAHLASFTADSYRAILGRRQLYERYAGKTPIFRGQMSDVVWGLVSAGQTPPGSALGIVKGLGFPSGGVNVTKTCSAGDFIGPKLDDLAYVQGGGFDYDITPKDQVQQTFDMWAPQRGADRGVILQYGDNLTGTTWSRSLDTSTYANAIRETGSSIGGSADPPPVEIDSAGIGTAPEGRWDGNYSTDEADVSLLQAKAELQLAGAAQFVPNWTIPLQPGMWGGPGHIWLGDTLRVVPATGRLAGSVEVMRLLSITANLSQESEQVILTLGQPRWDLPAQLKHMMGELRKSRLRQARGKNLRPGYQFIPAPSGD